MQTKTKNQTINAHYDDLMGWQFAFDDQDLTVTYYTGGIPTHGWTVWDCGQFYESHGDNLEAAMITALRLQRGDVLRGGVS